MFAFLRELDFERGVMHHILNNLLRHIGVILEACGNFNSEKCCCCVGKLHAPEPTLCRKLSLLNMEPTIKGSIKMYCIFNNDTMQAGALRAPFSL